MSKPHHNVLLVGQLYIDTILHVKKFPEEDTKLRADRVEQRIGGNTCNTAQVLAQRYDQLRVHYLSAVGSYKSSNHLVQFLENHHVDTNKTVLYRENEITPSSTIIHSEQHNSRTIISNNNLTDVNLKEFEQIFLGINGGDISTDSRPVKRWWVHFEGRNVDNVRFQVDWLNRRYAEQWRDYLTISVELEKPDRENISTLIELADIVFFSKLFAQYHGFKNAKSFMEKSPLLEKLKPNAKAFCTWGSEGASVLINETKNIIQVSPPCINNVVDTVGAGDTFIAGAIYSLLQDTYIMSEVLQFACNTATRKVAQRGFDNLL
ncbi:Ribokinase-like protein [Mycotypha africana]|uniref:Ribokinase-like protein n=1 Tax=Mycotypha africana TaxID=64632 RepID=UPI002301DB98|nr:Ribokinase-like protein [Mycotypha africana]KAI8991878.1 Ribokinase-like protein [Mycotypha africana]